MKKINWLFATFILHVAFFPANAQSIIVLRAGQRDTLQLFVANELLKAWGTGHCDENKKDVEQWRTIGSILSANSLQKPTDTNVVKKLMAENNFSEARKKVYEPLLQYRVTDTSFKDSGEANAVFIDRAFNQLRPTNQNTIGIEHAQAIKGSIASLLSPKPVDAPPVQNKPAIPDTTQNDTDSFQKGIADSSWSSRHPMMKWIFIVTGALLLITLLIFTIRNAMSKLPPDDKSYPFANDKYNRDTAGVSVGKDATRSNADIWLEGEFQKKATKTSSVDNEPEVSPALIENPATQKPKRQEKFEQSVKKKEEFFMTAPSADGTFSTAAKKASETGCLYHFTLTDANAKEASIDFCGSDVDMRNAQAFRDLELLPACEFLNLPNTKTFAFIAKENGFAKLDGNTWRVIKKIKIQFLP